MIDGFILSAQEVFCLLNQNIAANIRDCVRKRYALGAHFNAVLRKAAFLDSTIAGQCAQPVFLEDFSSWMVIEELDLGDSCSADEAGVVVELRADFHAAAA